MLAPNVILLLNLGCPECGVKPYKLSCVYGSEAIILEQSGTANRPGESREIASAKAIAIMGLST
jgi:hypothetical protein